MSPDIPDQGNNVMQAVTDKGTEDAKFNPYVSFSVNPTLKTLRELTSILLDTQRPASTLRPEIVALTRLLVDSNGVSPPEHGDIASGETWTSDGLALSPAMATMCMDDYVRTITFIRGTRAAIGEIRKRFPFRPARILYAGCGPLAALAVPLMAIFSSSEARFTLLDIHRESIDSARSIIDTLGFADNVSGFITADAGSFRIQADEPPDILLMELMQACLESEPQVAVARHLLSQAPDAIMIPEEVRIDLRLVNPSREFDLDRMVADDVADSRDRKQIGSAFVLNRESVDTWKSISGVRLPGSTIRIPESIEQGYESMLFTCIRVYREHSLEDYDSGLTSPRLFSTNTPLGPGDSIRFQYLLGHRPHLQYSVNSCTVEQVSVTNPHDYSNS